MADCENGDLHRDGKEDSAVRGEGGAKCVVALPIDVEHFEMGNRKIVGEVFVQLWEDGCIYLCRLVKMLCGLWAPEG